GQCPVCRASSLLALGGWASKLLALQIANQTFSTRTCSRKFAMIPFQCSGCGKNLQVKDESAGKKVKCPRCGQLVRAPEALATPAPRLEAHNAQGGTLSGSQAGHSELSAGGAPAPQ